MNGIRQKNRPRRGIRKGRRGSALLLVVALAAAFALIVGSLLQLTSTERDLNQRHLLWTQARYANLSALELAAVEIRESIADRGMAQEGDSYSIDLDKLGYYSFFEGSHLGRLVEEDTEVVIGDAPAVETRFIDPDNPSYVNDELIGMEVQSIRTPIYAKTTLEQFNGDRVTVYGQSTLEVRQAPLFSYAIFFNMELPMFAGGDIVADGRIHANGDITVSSNHDWARQVFFDSVSCTGEITDDPFFGNNNRGQTMFFAGPDSEGNPTYVSSMDQAVSYEAPGGQVVQGDAFDPGVDASGEPVSFGSLQNNGNSRDHIYSEDDNFYELALNNWNGFVKSGLHGVSTRTPPAMDEYDYRRRSDDPDFVNSAYQIIQPVREEDDPALQAPSPGNPNYDDAQKAYERNWTREKSKFAYQAGLIIEVRGQMVEKTDPKSGGESVYSTLAPDSASFSFHTYERDADGEILYEADGRPRQIDLELPAAITEPGVVLDIEPYVTDPNDSSQLISGMRDNRRERSLNLVKVNVGRLRQLVDDPGGLAADFPELAGANFDTFAEHWNGGVYVQFPHSPVNPRTGEAGAAADGVHPAVDGSGVYVHNGQRLPEGGLTLATNNPVYLAGHYNADGVIDADSTRAPEEGEQPAAIAADAVTLLSANWEPNGSAVHSTEGSSPSNRPAIDTEYSAAIIAGQVPRGKRTETGTQSNATVANFLRLHEDWGRGSKHYYLRGSVVALFESEIASQHLPGHADIYAFPGRNFGYNRLFDTQQPPIAPSTVVVKAVRHRLLTQAEYDAETGSL